MMTTSERIYALNSFLEAKPLSSLVKIFGICAGFANVTWENQISRTCAWKQDNTYHSQSSQISQAMDIIFATQVNKTCNGDNSLTYRGRPECFGESKSAANSCTQIDCALEILRCSM